jgi:hypothetical protein
VSEYGIGVFGFDLGKVGVGLVTRFVGSGSWGRVGSEVLLGVEIELAWK